MNADGIGPDAADQQLGASTAAAPGRRTGSKIAFTSNRDGNYEIYVMNADGTGQTRLTNNAGDRLLTPPGRPTARRSPSAATATATTRST